MSNENQNTTTTTATATKKATRLLIPMSDREAYKALPEEEKVKYMNDEEQAAFEKKPETFRKGYALRLQKQAADDELKAIKEQEEKEREERKAKAEKEKGVKAIITDVRNGKCQILRDAPFSQNQVINNRFKELNIPEEEREAIFERIKQDSVSSGSRLIPAKPAYTLSHSLTTVKRSDLVEPTDGGKPDITLSNSIRKSNMIQPLLVKPEKDTNGNPTGKFILMDGKRRFWVLDENESYPAVIVTGFPDETTEEKAEVIVNRIRNLNVLSTAETLTRMKTRGIDDTEIRRDMGFKTGEIDKITSVFNIGKELQDLVKGGVITPTVALSIAKLPENLRRELLTDYNKRKTENANSRISEADVTAIRQKRAKEAIKRDAPTLSGLAESTPPLEDAPAQVDKPAKKADAKTPANKGAK